MKEERKGKPAIAEQIGYVLPKLTKQLEIPFGDIVFSIRDGRCYKIMVNRSFLYSKLEEEKESE